MRTNHDSQSFGFIVAAVLLSGSAVFFYLEASAPKTAIVIALFAGLSFLAALLEAPRSPSIEIDDEGLYDPRLGIAKIFWKEVRDFYVDESEGNRFLCLQVQRPERFLLHADRSKIVRMKHQHELGFRRINVDMKHVNMNVEQLHERIERRIRHASREAN